MTSTAVAHRVRRALGSRKALAWTIPDQVVYSVSNLLLASQISRGAGALDAALFASAYSVAQIVVSVVRSLSSEVLLTDRRLFITPDLIDGAVRRVLFIVSGVALLVTGAFFLVHPNVSTLVLLAMPVLCIQDRARFEWIQRGEPIGALRMDGLWFVVQVTWLAISGAVWSPSPMAAITAWLMGSFISLLFARRLRSQATWRSAWEWVTSTKRAFGALAAQSALGGLTAQVPVFIFSAAGEPYAAVGYLAATSMLGLQTAYYVATRPFALREMTRRPDVDLRKALATSAGVMALPGIVAGGVGIAVVRFLGHAVFGTEVQLSALAVVGWLCGAKALGALSVICVAVLRLRGRWGLNVVGEMFTALTMGGLPLLVVIVVGRTDLLAATVFGGALLSVLFWVILTANYGGRHDSGAGRVA